MKSLKVELTHEELDMLINKFDISGNGELSYSCKLVVLATSVDDVYNLFLHTYICLSFRLDISQSFWVSSE